MIQLGEAVAPGESEFEYDDGCGFDPVLWLPASAQQNHDNLFAYDLSPYGQPRGTWSGSTAQRNAVTDRGRAWTLAAGNSDYVTPAKELGTLLDNASQFTLAASVRPSQVANDATVLSRWGGAEEDQQIKFWLDTDGDGRGYAGAMFDGGDYHIAGTDAATAQVGVWAMPVITWDGATLSVYVDAVFIDSVEVAARNATLGRFLLGAQDDGVYWSGEMAWAAAWPQALTLSQIRLLHKSTLDGSPGCMARPIGPLWFLPAVAAGVTLVVQDSECIVESGSLNLTQHHVLAVAGSECLVVSEQPALTQHHVLVVGGSECVVTSEPPSLVQHHVLAVADSKSVVESDNVTLTAHEAEFTVRNSQVNVTSESPSLTQHHVLVVADTEIAVVSDSPELAPRQLLVLGDCVSLVVSESPVLTLHFTAPSVIRRGPSTEDTSLRRGPGSTNGTLRRPSDSS